MFRNKEHFYIWLSGITDGEGCFMIEHRVTNWRRGKKISLVGLPSEFYPSFIIGLRADDKAVLEEISQQLGFGYVYYKKPTLRGNASFTLRVSGKHCLRLIEIFDKYPIMSKKRRDYQVWRSFTLARYMDVKDYEFLSQCFRGIKEVRKYKNLNGSVGLKEQV